MRAISDRVTAQARSVLPRTPVHHSSELRTRAAERTHCAPHREPARFGDLLRQQRNLDPHDHRPAGQHSSAPVPPTMEAPQSAVPVADTEMSRHLDALGRAPIESASGPSLRVVVPGAVELDVRGSREVNVTLLRQGLAVERLREALCAQSWTLRETPTTLASERGPRGTRDGTDGQRVGDRLEQGRVESVPGRIR